jgi:hypothetical protein
MSVTSPSAAEPAHPHRHIHTDTGSWADVPRIPSSASRPDHPEEVSIMATPLADLLSGLRTDIELRGEFAHAPREFLDAHGWASLDVADLREACYILADGSPPDDAAQWLTSGHALDTPDDDPATALLAALDAVAPIAFDLDPAAMDGIDADESHDDAHDDTHDESHDDTHDATDSDADADADGQGVTDTWPASEAWHDDPDESPIIDAAPEPELDAGLDDLVAGSDPPFATPSDTTVDSRDAGDFGDDWDEII